MSERTRRGSLTGVACIVIVAPFLLAAAARRSPAVESLLPKVPLSVQRSINIEPIPTPEIPIKLESVNSGESATLTLMEGGYATFEQAAAFEQFFRCRRSGKHMPLSPGVLALLADVAQRYPGKVLEIVSGFRAPPFGVPHSRH